MAEEEFIGTEPVHEKKHTLVCSSGVFHESVAYDLLTKTNLLILCLSLNIVLADRGGTPKGKLHVYQLCAVSSTIKGNSIKMLINPSRLLPTKTTTIFPFKPLIDLKKYQRQLSRP